MLKKLVPTLKVKGELKNDTFNSRNYISCRYDNMELLLNHTSKNPQSEIIGKINNKYYLLEGGEAETNNIVFWIKRQLPKESFREKMVRKIANLFN